MDVTALTVRELANLRTFCETYFADAFYRPWSPDHLRAIEKIKRVVKSGGLFAFAMPRGLGKTTLARLSALWAVLGGYRPFVCLIGGSQERTIELLTPIRKAVLEKLVSTYLAKDFRRSERHRRPLRSAKSRLSHPSTEGLEKSAYNRWDSYAGVDHLSQPSRYERIKVRDVAYYR